VRRAALDRRVLPRAAPADATFEVRIEGLSASCLIGTRAWERRVTQPVRIDITFAADLAAAASADDIALAVDYKDLKDRVLRHVAASRFHLLEALAASVADLVLADARVASCDVTVAKPGALTGAESVAVRIQRRRAP
jgi:7,8-dihydroneopterin aldolase/epimerase/oxygenase